ncbi:LytR/AlgR family response regulator transcription factor [Lacticaseibacillus jixiensis]|uniref:LytR/AlgR family response regulator transcription factor n=1 Tax=Lacticaseibacillus jixiensis TaxID=3231926 RepID=UPI0036F2A045
MNLPILICDDEPHILAQYQEVIDHTIQRNDYAMEVVLATTNPHEVQSYLIAHPTMSEALFLLDIDLHAETSGIDLAAQIRHQDDRAQIVFVTAHRELAFETLKRRIAALDFIEKGHDDQAQICDLLAASNAAFTKRGEGTQQTFAFRVGSRLIRVELASVYYIEASVKPHKLALYGKNYMYEFYAKLNDIAQAYPMLLRVHKSYLINPAQITSIDYKKREIHFPDEYVCTFPLAMSRRLRQLTL